MKRNNQKKLLLDILPKSQYHILLVASILVCILPTICVLVLISSLENTLHEGTSITDINSFQKLVEGSHMISHVLEVMPNTRHLHFQITFMKSLATQDLDFELKYKLNIYVGKSKRVPYLMHHDWQSVHVECPAGNLQVSTWNNTFDSSSSVPFTLLSHSMRTSIDSTFKDTYSTQMDVDFRFCKPTTLIELNSIPFHFEFPTQVVVEMQLQGLEAIVYWDPLLSEALYMNWEYESQAYNLLEVSLRVVYIISSMIVLTVYSYFLFTRQAWRYCKKEQKYVLFFLILMILYNNPFFILDLGIVVGPSRFIGILLNCIFKTTALCYFLYFFVVSSHSLLTLRKEQTFWQFYFPKLLLSLVTWLILFLQSILDAFKGEPTGSESLKRRISDGSYDIIGIILLYINLNYILASLLIFYCLVIVYHVTRSVLQIFNQQRNQISLEGSTHHVAVVNYSIYSKRLRLFLVASLLIVLFLLLFLLLHLLQFRKVIAFPIELFQLLNGYTLPLAFLFSPSHTSETDMREIIVAQFEKEQELADASDDASLLGPEKSDEEL